MKKYDLVTVLDLCIDLLVDLGTTELEFGQKEKLVDDYIVELGGSATIFASQASKLGLNAAGIGKVGEDVFGKIILEKLLICGVNCKFVKKDKGLKTGLGIALCKTNDRAILTYAGSLDSVEPDDFPMSILAQTRHLHIASYYLMEKIQPHYKEILSKAKYLGVTVSLDTNWDPAEQWKSGLNEILPLVDIFLPNENEAMAISGTRNLDEAIEKLSAIVPVVVVKRGADGSIAISKNKKYKAESFTSIVKDTVGAGDSFDAGFVYGFLSGYDMQKCLDIASICGSLSTEQPGGISGQPSLSIIENVLLQYSPSLGGTKINF